MYDQCGSKPDLNGRFYENNIVIQYDKDLIEVSCIKNRLFDFVCHYLLQ